MIQYDEDIVAKRIKQVEKLLGESSDPDCRHCDWPAGVIGEHAPDCMLRKIDPATLEQGMIDADIVLKKTINRQRIFRGEVKTFNSGPPIPKSACKTKKRPPKDPPRELKRCRVCFEQRLFIRNICQTCQHSKPCSWDDAFERPCPICFPGDTADKLLKKVRKARRKKKHNNKKKKK